MGFFVDAPNDGSRKQPFQGGPDQPYRSRRSIRFRPKRRASIDRTPGPSIARAAPNVANAMQMRRSPVLVNIDHNSTITTNTPVTGVHKPTRKSIPAAVSNSGRITPGHWAPPCSSMTPLVIKRVLETTRKSRRPRPGHPFGNIEKSRCTETSTTSVSVQQPSANLQKLVSLYPPFEGDHSSMIPRFNPIVTACVRSFAPNGKDALHVALHSLFGD